MKIYRFLSLSISLFRSQKVSGSEAAKKEAQEAFILDLVRRSKISKGKAAELLGISLWNLPDLVAQYQLPWFSYPPEELEKDLETLHKHQKGEGNTP
jgi:predicted HTH domain antitoxin